MDKPMDTPEDIRVQEMREEYNDAWDDAHRENYGDYLQMLIDEDRDEEGRCLRCGSADKKTRFVVAYLGEDPRECDGPFHG